jgi:hypothetical protein
MYPFLNSFSSSFIDSFIIVLRFFLSLIIYSFHQFLSTFLALFVSFSIYYSPMSYFLKFLPLSLKTKLRGFSPQANYTDRATAACRRS